MALSSSASAVSMPRRGWKHNSTGGQSIEYRKFGRLDWEVSVLGFGVMRLPHTDKDRSRTNEIETSRMLRYAIEHGVNYLDLGYLHDHGRREQVTRCIGRALRDGYRRKVKIAASLPAFLIKFAEDFEHYLDECLDWLQTDKLDFFLPAGLNRETWPNLAKQDVLSHAEAAIADGRLGWLGFAFHDDFQTLRSVLEDYDNWSLVRFQYSFMDVDHHPGTGGLKYAADKGLAVVIAEPLKGGRLTEKPPETVAGIWADNSPAEWGLRWVWNHPEVSTVVSDMSTLAQVKENIALAENARADGLTVADELIINRVRDAYRELRPIPCTTCRGCMPCPLGVDVPRIFELYNDAVMYDDRPTARSIYRDERHDIDACNACGVCAQACGRRIPIPDWLEKARGMLAGDK
jgi:predicted aldo/keto reductase-like oxidoreductase